MVLCHTCTPYPSIPRALRFLREPLSSPEQHGEHVIVKRLELAFDYHESSSK